MENRPTIKDLPLEERPRERLIHNGPEHLAAAELIAIILRTGSANRTAINVAEELIATYKDLRGLAKASVAEIAHCHGIGPAKAVQLKAAFELGRRVLTSNPVQQPAIRNPQDIFDLLKASFQDLDREHFKVVHLNTKNQVLKIETTAIGILSSSPVHPREVFKEAVKMSSAGVVLAHNHPSGDPTPSKDDLLLTSRLREAGEILGISVIDHVIFGDNRYISLKERGHLS
ncbi:DNA replication and repair protein RadC [Hydrogenispora ethanolica]|uniref:DNA replication and repair protein RadC n=1 Tax=Hydrogenispora ethanolica TaxID=1082276 RepID=A0A4R1RW96_HYDET|nr:DNA repair protein RadC [Hydrogenispora ethanolica]TCL70951.1 DNA replication and repair protein RadC [Hydrogenispora ethanolica]